MSVFLSHRSCFISACVLVLACCGCTSTGGIFGTGAHKLLNTAESMALHSANPLPLPRELAKVVLPDYRVEPGDVLLVEPVDFEASLRLPGDQTVQPDGVINLGRYGQVPVVGKTIPEIRDAVQRIINEYEDGDEKAEITVRLTEPQSKVYYVLGEVNSPGAYPVIGRETVLDAIVMAGDLTGRANRHKVILSRPGGPNKCRVVLPICYRHIVQLGDTSTNYQIQPGDRIFVASLSIFEEISQTLFRGFGESCPHCASPQYPCPETMIPGEAAVDMVGEPFPLPHETSPIEIEEIPPRAAATRSRQDTRSVQARLRSSRQAR